MIANAEGKMYQTPYAVICRRCGLQCLSEENYTLQINRPNSLWVCPRCGDTAHWDDDCPATNPKEDDFFPGAHDE